MGHTGAIGAVRDIAAMGEDREAIGVCGGYRGLDGLYGAGRYRMECCR